MSQENSAESTGDDSGNEGAIPRPWPVRLWEQRRRILAWGAAATALVLVAGALWWGVPRLRCGGLGNGVSHVDGECVGVTDGSFVFAEEELGEVQRNIDAENRWAASRAEQTGVPLVKVALLAPLTPEPNGAITPGQVRSALEGAYVALRRANRSGFPRGDDPLIQLRLANEGSRQAQWRTTVSRIEEMTEDDVPLVAVLGQALSTTRTRRAAERLSDRGIPMVTGATTADGLDHAEIPGLIRAAPSNTDFAAALDGYVDGRDDLETAVMVFDRVSDDLFVNTLRTAYEEKLGDHIAFPDQPFSGRAIADEGTNVFYPITQNICSAEPDMVFFAGRATDMRLFIDALASSAGVCTEPLSVLFAEVGMYPWDDEALDTLHDRDITILNASGFDPRWAEGGGQDPPDGFAAFRDHFGDLVDRSPEALDNGYAATYHDAMAVTVNAIRITDPRNEDAPPPAPQDIRDRLLLLNEQHDVQGATGTLSFTQDRSGNPVGKHVPVVPVPFSEEAGDSATYVTGS
ncbi:ABC transporter substrate-binding protein [Streptomonospora salina]|uniref:ABC-type branched-subunit amino acid transport system substrate-binding protein n=1 Tax=Streptomonospora salina TaxID=104205 RepID=A0A841EJB3_9ACTN|nr:hypothetical protein [Streptomonospora salina]MBB5999511.1 ABC-type branched-subunit amino acid transport system substrate-binding protein [Streptomonospora salina]